MPFTRLFLLLLVLLLAVRLALALVLRRRTCLLPAHYCPSKSLRVSQVRHDHRSTASRAGSLEGSLGAKAGH